MVAAEGYLPVIFVLVFLLSKTFGLVNIREWCPKDAIVDLTNDTPDSSGSVYKSGNVYLPESTWTEDGGRILGCPCLLKVCVPLCCPLEYASNSKGDCIEDELTPQIIHFRSEVTNELYYEFTSNPCKSMRKESVSRKSDFSIRKDGSIGVPDIAWPVPVGSYCLSREPNSTLREAFICQRTSDRGSNPWIVVSVIIFTFSLLSGFVVYIVQPELKNLSGMTFRRYLVTFASLGCRKIPRRSRSPNGQYFGMLDKPRQRL